MDLGFHNVCNTYQHLLETFDDQDINILKDSLLKP